MTVITLNEEQTRLIGDATAPIVLVDASGRELGTVSPPDLLPPDATDKEVVADIQRRMASDCGARRPFSDLLKDLRGQFPE